MFELVCFLIFVLFIMHCEDQRRGVSWNPVVRFDCWRERRKRRYYVDTRSEEEREAEAQRTLDAWEERMKNFPGGCVH